MEGLKADEAANRGGEGSLSQEASMDSLPLEVLIKIISLLPLKQQLRARRVSRIWSTVVDLNLKTSQKLHIDQPEKLDDCKLKLLLRKMPELRSLTCEEEDYDMFAVAPLTKFCLNTVLECCPHLEVVDLRRFCLDPESLQQVSSTCAGLKSVHLPFDTDDVILKELLARLTGLRSLDLTKTEVEGACFSLLPDTLERLDLIGGRLKADFFRSLARCSQLRDLRVLGSSSELQCDDLTSVLAGCPRLECLWLTYNVRTESQWLQQLSGCPRLTELHLSTRAYDAWCSEEDITVVLAECPLLERLTLTGWKFHRSSWLQRLFEARRLKELNLSRVGNIRPTDLAEGLTSCQLLGRLVLINPRDVYGGPLLLGRCLPPPGSLPALRHLTLASMVILDKCLEQLSLLLPELRSLEVTVTHQGPTEQGWVSCLSQLCRLQALRLCTTSRWPVVSDALLEALQGLPLKKLDLMLFGGPATAAVDRLVSACLSLRHLHLRLPRDGGMPERASFLGLRLPAGRDITVVVEDNSVTYLRSRSRSQSPG